MYMWQYWCIYVYMCVELLIFRTKCNCIGFHIALQWIHINSKSLNWIFVAIKDWTNTYTHTHVQHVQHTGIWRARQHISPSSVMQAECNYNKKKTVKKNIVKKKKIAEQWCRPNATRRSDTDGTTTHTHVCMCACTKCKWKLTKCTSSFANTTTAIATITNANAKAANSFWSEAHGPNRRWEADNTSSCSKSIWHKVVKC